MASNSDFFRLFMYFQSLTRGIDIGANCYLLSLGNARMYWT